MRVLVLKVPPLAVGVLLAALMWLVSRAMPALSFVFPGRKSLALSFAITGAMIIIVGVASFRRAKTTINPMKPESSSSLVVSGIYKFSRNPMYLGFLLVLVGWAVFLSNALAFIFLPVFICYMNRFQIEPEEKALAGKFGQEFVDYKSRVRRWL
ncbi:MAG TPA: isoprenylcysteine carboxylmethyltransferase family protein [Candidatus Binatia bacterium]